MSNGEPHQIHTIDVGDHGFIIVERLTLSERERENAPDRDIRLSSHIGGSGILQRLDRGGAIELIEALAEAAGIEIARLNVTPPDAHEGGQE